VSNLIIQKRLVEEALAELRWLWINPFRP